MAGAEGLELSTSGFGDRRSSQLSYAPNPNQRKAAFHTLRPFVSRGRPGCSAVAPPSGPGVLPHLQPWEDLIIKWNYADVAQLVELQISNLNVASSNLVVRSNNFQVTAGWPGWRWGQFSSGRS
jgi:hypothetical protein